MRGLRIRPWLALALFATAQCTGRDPGLEDASEWRSWAGDPGSTHYSPLDEIDATNFGELQLAWRWQSADVRWKRRKGGPPLVAKLRRGVILTQFQVTPLMVKGVLYGITSIGQVFALDAGTGRELWIFDPESYLHARPGTFEFSFPKHRGVAYWEQDREQDKEQDPEPAEEARILVTTLDAYLVALDARSGRPIESFGAGGRVDLLQGLRRTGIRRIADYFQSSPALVVGDVVVVGSSVDDRPTSPDAVPGDVRAYDARTGELRWTFHVIPAEGEFGTDTWEQESWRYSGAANVWGPMSADPELGYVYLVTSTPTSDFYGGHRLGDNLFAETILCLDAETGERIWHFQLIHHGLWDYDPAAAPNLVDLDIAGKRIRAVAQVTKQGLTFVFDRATGEPIFPIEERSVPSSDVPGERASETQPFPVRPPPFERQGISEADLIDYTPELRAEALDVFRRYRTGPVFTPPSLRGTLILPGAGGGANWQGAGFDPDTGVLYVPSVTQPGVISLKAADSPANGFRYVLNQTSGVSLADSGRTPHPISMLKPPYSRITAIDLERGEILWQEPNGDGPRKHPLLAHLDLPPMGSGVPACVLVTRSLLFAADGAGSWLSLAGEPIFRAYDKATGQVVGRLDVPSRARGCPMTYRHEGRQFIVLPVSDQERSPELVALALAER